MKFKVIGWHLENAHTFEELVQLWLDDHKDAKIVNITYSTPRNERGIIISIFAFIVYQED